MIVNLILQSHQIFHILKINNLSNDNNKRASVKTPKYLRLLADSLEILLKIYYS